MTLLPGLPVIQDLGLRSSVEAIDTSDNYVGQYPEVFSSLGMLEREYK